MKQEYRIELFYGVEASIPVVTVTVEADSLETAKKEALAHGPTVSSAWGLDRCNPLRAGAARI